MSKKQMRRPLSLVLVGTLAMSLFAGAGIAFAYYTDVSQASGMVPYSYAPTPGTEVEEWPDGADKIVMVKNTGNSPAMVRVQVFAPSIDGLEVTISPDSVVPDDSPATGPALGAVAERGTWVRDDRPGAEGWWYFTAPLGRNESTSALRVAVTVDPMKVSQAFDVAVVQQCAPVKTTDDGVYYGAFDPQGKDDFVPTGDAAVVAPKAAPAAAGAEDGEK